MFWLTIVILFCFLFYYYLIKPHRFWVEKGVKQFKPNFLVGIYLRMILGSETFKDLLDKIYYSFKDSRYTGFYQILIPTLLIKDPELIRRVTVKDFDHFTDHISLVPNDPVLGKTLIALHGEDWKEMRSTLTPAFTTKKMRTMYVLISDVCEKFILHFLEQKEDLITIDLRDSFTRFTNDVIATTAFGVEVNSLKDRNNKFYIYGKQATHIGGWKNCLKIFGYFLFPKIYNLLKLGLLNKDVIKFFRSMIIETLEARIKSKIIRPDLLNLLKNARKDGIQYEETTQNISERGFTANVVERQKEPRKLTDDDITSQSLLFFFAAFDTIASIMCFMSYELALNQHIQEKLREEIQETSIKCKNELTYEAIISMKYMDMVLSESLRKWPSVLVTDRVCTKPYVIKSISPEEPDIYLQKNDVIWIPIYSIQNDPKHYESPENFHPERFSDKNKEKIKPYTYMPFGTGPRNCIGNRFALFETKCLFFHILRHFKIVPVKKSQIPVKLKKYDFHFSAENGFWFGLEKLKK